VKVVFVNRYFHPDHSATSQMASDLAFHLARRGWQVEAITSRQRYDDARAKLAPTSNEQGVQVTRVWSTRFGRAGLAGRAVDYATFYGSAFLALLSRRDAVVIAMTDPPLLSILAAFSSKRIVNWVQDLFPEVAEALGIKAPRALQRLRDWSLRRARANVVLGDLMAARVPKATVIHNWADAALAPMPRSGTSVPRYLGTSDEPDDDDAASAAPEVPRYRGTEVPFIVAYSGNLGRAHDVDTILGAMKRVNGVRFVFTGGGAKLDAVKSAGAEVRPYAPREKLSESLSDADVHLVSLQPSLEGLIVPSKFYGVLAVARPVIFIGARDGELARIIDAHRCGIVVASGDDEGLARAIERLRDDRAEAAAMGERGRALYLERFAPERAFAAWERVLEEAAG
jgi:colanic acid biosynthesis glycosyl transferase WcaI